MVKLSKSEVKEVIENVGPEKQKEIEIVHKLKKALISETARRCKVNHLPPEEKEGYIQSIREVWIGGFLRAGYSKHFKALDFCKSDFKDENLPVVPEVIESKANAWKLENGLWYPKPDVVFGVCPLCGDPGKIRHVWRNNYKACHACRVAWLFGENLISAWREFTDQQHAESEIYIESMLNADKIYEYHPLSSEAKEHYSQLLRNYKANIKDTI